MAWLIVFLLKIFLFNRSSLLYYLTIHTHIWIILIPKPLIFDFRQLIIVTIRVTHKFNIILLYFSGNILSAFSICKWLELWWNHLSTEIIEVSNVILPSHIHLWEERVGVLRWILLAVNLVLLSVLAMSVGLAV